MQSFAIIMCMQLIAKHYHSKSQQSGAVILRSSASSADGDGCIMLISSTSG